jgi:phosphoribosyl 1,2-cyclic phosphodiesterase
MSLFVSALASGSNGNCYYIGNEKEAVLIDAGVSCREIERRMKRLNLSMQKVKAVFISHEHTDHIRGVFSLVKKHSVPVYITPATLQFSGLKLDIGYTRWFTSTSRIQIGDLEIIAFPKLHDASDPYSFVVSYKETRVGVFTDIGLPCQNVISHFSQCHAVFLETNYDDEMLDKGSYPFHLKRRIRGERGHLSNKQALDLFLQHRSTSISHLFLSHLSKNNNDPELAKTLFEQHANGVKIIVASRYEETPVFRIERSKDRLSAFTELSSPQLELSFG